MTEHAHLSGSEWSELVARVRTAERQRDEALAMLDEILALDEVETPGVEENAATVVHDALTHLARQRDEALRVLREVVTGGCTLGQWGSCFYCHRHVSRGAEDRLPIDLDEHVPGCLWVVARKLLEETDDE